MDLGIKNKVAIIGGSSKGLGRGCALSLAKEGVNIVLCANEKISLESTAEEISKLNVEVLPLLVDMSLASDNDLIVRETLSRFGKIDILINNSGGPKPGTYMDFDNSDWDKAYNDVLKYVIRMTNLVIPIMKKNKWGRIINITSLTVKEPPASMILSNVFRTGVVSYSKSISKDLIENNITINNLCPGAFKTDRSLELLGKTASDKNITIEEVESDLVKKLPLKRLQLPQELGDIATFLASENAKGITGTTIQIDGGISNCIL